MPTNQDTYNSRVTDEALEKRFRDTFTSQGGAELVSDLYASGVIVPVVDFTAAAEGSSLRSDLQTAWDFSTGLAQVNSSSPVDIISGTGFWLVDLAGGVFSRGVSQQVINIYIDTGLATKTVWQYRSATGGTDNSAVAEGKFIVFLRSGDSLKGTNTGSYSFPVWYRQVADVSGNLVNPLGFTSS